MSYKYWLPDEQGEKVEYETDSNSIVIVGANGAGKSKLGAWIEKQSWNDVHRIGAQRNLNFNENIPLKNYKEAENLVFYGKSDGKDLEKNTRWQWGHYTTRLMDDFDNVLSALIALKNNEVNKFAQECKDAGNDKNKWPDIPITSIEKLKEIWSTVLPQRGLIEDDSKFYAFVKKEGGIERYSATEMSDGERAVLYLTAQVLCVPYNKILIIDEPEIHLHPSIMNRLWKTLESYRNDCLFIYITHDLQFASAHGSVDKIWIKSFDGLNWTLKKIIDENLPEELVLEVLGSRRSLLFVEGEKNSYDYQLYTQLYQDYLIIPCGGCSQVISRTKAFKNSKTLHEYAVYGLIDRDYRTQQEIDVLKKHGVYTLDVAEVENLFIVEEVIKIMAERFAVEDVNRTLETVKTFVINTKYSNMLNKQICQSVVAEIKYQLSCIEIDKKNDDNAKDSLNEGLSAIDYDEIKAEKEAIFKKALCERNYAEVLKVFNEKGVASEIGALLGINKQEYQAKVIKLVHSDGQEEIIKALAKYLPDEIPR